MKRKCRTTSHQASQQQHAARISLNGTAFHMFPTFPNMSQLSGHLGLGMAAEQEEIAVVGLGSEDYGGVIDHSFSQQLLAKHEGLMVICTGFNDD